MINKMLWAVHTHLVNKPVRGHGGEVMPVTVTSERNGQVSVTFESYWNEPRRFRLDTKTLDERLPLSRCWSKRLKYGGRRGRVLIRHEKLTFFWNKQDAEVYATIGTDATRIMRDAKYTLTRLRDDLQIFTSAGGMIDPQVADLIAELTKMTHKHQRPKLKLIQ